MTLGADFNVKGMTQDKRDNILIAAVKARDPEKIARVLQDGADPNARDGLPLRTAAENDDYLSAKALMLHHADIGYALLRAQAEHNAIPRESKGTGLLTAIVPQTEEGRGTEIKLNHQINKLTAFQKTFISSTLPQEQLHLLREMNTRLIKLEKQVHDLTAPSRIEKSGKLPAPQSLRAPGKT